MRRGQTTASFHGERQQIEMQRQFVEHFAFDPAARRVEELWRGRVPDAGHGERREQSHAAERRSHCIDRRATREATEGARRSPVAWRIEPREFARA